MKKLLQTLRWPLLIEIANSLSIQFMGKSTALLIPSWIITVSIIFWGGWLVMKEKWGTLCRAAFVGPIIIIIGLMLIGATYQLITGDFVHMAETVKSDVNPRLLYLGGVIVSTLMFSPLFALISLLGGVVGRSHFNKSKPKTI